MFSANFRTPCFLCSPSQPPIWSRDSADHITTGAFCSIFVLPPEQNNRGTIFKRQNLPKEGQVFSGHISETRRGEALNVKIFQLWLVSRPCYWPVTNSSSCIVHEDEVRICPWAAATSGPIIHPPDGIWVWGATVEWFWKVNRKTRRKTCPSATLFTVNPTRTDLRAIERLAINRLSHGTEHFVFSVNTYIRIHTCMHAYMSTYIHTHIHTYIHTHTCIHACIHTYIHTYRQTDRQTVRQTEFRILNPLYRHGASTDGILWLI
jgi:hypothetical protein